MYTSGTKHFACVQAEREVEEILHQMLAIITTDFAQLATNLLVAQSLKHPTDFFLVPCFLTTVQQLVALQLNRIWIHYS